MRFHTPERDFGHRSCPSPSDTLSILPASTDELHNPDPKRDHRVDKGGSIFTWRGLMNLGFIALLVRLTRSLHHLTPLCSPLSLPDARHGTPGYVSAHALCWLSDLLSFCHDGLGRVWLQVRLLGRTAFLAPRAHARGISPFPHDTDALSHLICSLGGVNGSGQVPELIGSAF
jgi:hypothetical protein